MPNTEHTYKQPFEQRTINSNSTNPIPSSFSPPNKTIWLLGDTITLKVTGNETNGKYSVWEIRAPSQSGSPPHYHPKLEEVFYILEGKFSFQYNENIVNVSSGQFVHVPRDVVHTYKNIGNSTGKLLVIGIPAGFGNFVKEFGIIVTDQSIFIPSSGAFEIERIVEISKKYGITYVPALKKATDDGSVMS